MLHCARRRFQERPCMAEIFAKAVKVDGCSSRCVRFNAPSEYARRKGEGKCSRRQGATGPAPHLRRAARAGEHRRPERAREGQGAFGEVGAGGACNVHCTAEGGESRKVRPWCRMGRCRDGWCSQAAGGWCGREMHRNGHFLRGQMAGPQFSAFGTSGALGQSGRYIPGEGRRELESE